LSRAGPTPGLAHEVRARAYGCAAPVTSHVRPRERSPKIVRRAAIQTLTASHSAVTPPPASWTRKQAPRPLARGRRPGSALDDRRRHAAVSACRRRRGGRTRAPASPVDRRPRKINCFGVCWPDATDGPSRCGRSRQDLDVPVGSVHADPLPVPDQPGGIYHTDDGRQAVLPGDHCAMGHQAAHLRHQARDRDEQG
jgi:hypothetical protein